MRDPKTGAKTVTVPKTYDPAVPSELALAWLRWWQAPLLLGTTWWNAMIQANWPVRDGKHPSSDPHDQLVVPEPIEQDGERALVA